MTHVKNTEAFARLIDFCTGYGGKYNPGRPNLQIDALANQLIETQSAIEQVRAAKNNFDNLANQRKQTFDQLPKLVSSILRTLEASGAKPEKLDDARAFAHQIIGASHKNRAPVPADAQTKPVAKRSKLQLAYVSRADAFVKLAKAVSSDPVYQPREKMFASAGLEEKIQELAGANRQVDEARAAWSKARIARNEVMYSKDASLVETARAVKKYVRAIFGPSSEQYALLKTLDFTALSTT